MSTKRLIKGFLLAFAFVICHLAQAQYPVKPVRIVVPNAPGSSIDIIARVLAERYQAAWSQAVVVENRAGANGIIATEFVAKSEPGGYTLTVHPAAVFTFHPALYDKLPFDVLKDFAPISQLAASTIWIVVNASLPVRNVVELVALAKAQPGKLSYSTAGGASGLPYIASVLVQNLTGTRIEFVSYKGGNQALTDLLGGQIQVMFDSAASSIAQVRTGRLRALAVISSKRMQSALDVPTIAEAGLPDATGEAWNGLSTRAGTSPEIIRRIHADTVAALRLPEVSKKLESIGFEIIGNSPEEFTAVIRAEMTKWGKVIRDNKIRAE